jgi:hypothetical protein
MPKKGAYFILTRQAVLSKAKKTNLKGNLGRGIKKCQPLWP